MSPAAVQKLHRWHAWSGLIFGANIFFLSITGALLVFYAELRGAVSPGPPLPLPASAGITESARPIGAAESGKPLAALVDRVLARYPGARPAHIRLARPADGPGAAHDVAEYFHRLDLDIPVAAPGDTGDAERAQHLEIFLDPVSGDFARASSAVDVPRIVFLLHGTLLAGSVGKILLGLVALALLVSSVTGLLIYGPFTRNQSFWSALRPGLPLRLRFADWHKLLGVSSLAFQLLMAMTGLLLTFGTIVIQIYSYVVVSELANVSHAPVRNVIAIDRVLQSARAVHADRHIKMVFYPGQFQGDAHFAVLAYGSGVFGQYIPQLSMIEAEASRQARPAMVVELPWYIKLIAGSAPLHFGNFGGLWLKIVYCVFGLTGGALAISGYVMYVLKYRRRNK